MKIILVLLMGVINFISAQTKDPDKILDEVKKKFASVKDYTVDVNIKIDVNFLKVPESRAKIYYKAPDKIHVESESFAMLPREGLNSSPAAFLNGEYTALYEREDTVDNKKVSIVKIIPLNSESDIVLSTLWIDQDKDVIMKIESNTKVAGTFQIEFDYDEKSNYPLPSKMEFTLNTGDFSLPLPRGMTGDTKKKTEERSAGKEQKGKVYITYSNYKVN